MKYFIILFLCIGCAARTPPVAITVPVNSSINSLPSDTEQPVKEPDLSKLESYPATPILENTPAPKSGVLISPRRAAEIALREAELDKLRVENKVIIRTRETEIKLYENNQREIQEQLKKAVQRSWWDEYGGSVLFTTGALSGISISLLIFKLAVQTANK